jgi:hypothetical protein
LVKYQPMESTLIRPLERPAEFADWFFLAVAERRLGPSLAELDLGDCGGVRITSTSEEHELWRTLAPFTQLN